MQLSYFSLRHMLPDIQTPQLSNDRFRRKADPVSFPQIFNMGCPCLLRPRVIKRMLLSPSLAQQLYYSKGKKHVSGESGIHIEINKVGKFQPGISYLLYQAAMTAENICAALGLAGIATQSEFYADASFLRAYAARQSFKM